MESDFLPIFAKKNNNRMNIFILFLAVFPVFLLSIYIYHKDKFEKEPFGMLVKVFLFGCLSTIPAVLLEAFLMSFSNVFGNGIVLGSAYHGFVVAGFSEELCKLLLLTFAVWRSRHFNEYFDGIVYAVYVSLGFACVENIMYIFQNDTMVEILYTGITRAVLSVPAHFLFGVAMGYYFALIKFEPEKKFSHIAKTLFVPLALHGTFDTLLFIYSSISNERPIIALALFGLFIFFDIKMWKLGKRKMRNMQMKSELQ